MIKTQWHPVASFSFSFYFDLSILITTFESPMIRHLMRKLGYLLVLVN